MVAEGYSVRHLPGFQQFLVNGELGNIYSLPGLENPADGVAEVKSDILPLLRLLESSQAAPFE